MPDTFQYPDLSTYTPEQLDELHGRLVYERTRRGSRKPFITAEFAPRTPAGIAPATDNPALSG